MSGRPSKRRAYAGVGTLSSWSYEDAQRLERKASSRKSRRYRAVRGTTASSRCASASSSKSVPVSTSPSSMGALATGLLLRAFLSGGCCCRRPGVSDVLCMNANSADMHSSRRSVSYASIGKLRSISAMPALSTAWGWRRHRSCTGAFAVGTWRGRIARASALAPSSAERREIALILMSDQALNSFNSPTTSHSMPTPSSRSSTILLQLRRLPSVRVRASTTCSAA